MTYLIILQLSFRIHEVFGILPTELKTRCFIHSAPQPLSTDRLQARLKLLGVNATHIEAHQPYSSGNVPQRSIYPAP